MIIFDLLQIMPSPQKDFNPANDWPRIQSELNLELPMDYKKFIDEYNTGRIADFIIIFSPFAKNANVNLLNQIHTQTGILQELHSSGEKIPYELFPKEGGILPFGITDNGDVFFWKTGLNVWHVIVNEARSDEWEYFELSFLDFLEHFLLGKLKSKILPAMSISKPIEFSPLTC
jgi:hypothetical protein